MGLKNLSGQKNPTLQVQVKHDNQMERLPLYVVQKGGAILSGRA
jgi:hypothetical protein